MGKSSASLKRKRSKNSSKAKPSSKIKSRKSKSKKVRRRREASLSSSDNVDSKSLDASASSSSEDSKRRKRDRSHTRKDVKGRKKKARRRSYRSDSSEDSLYARKRKKAKRKREYEVREKPHRKKKIRREGSDSLTSGGSWSCSTCQGGSASSDDNQYESRRGRSERKEKDKRRLERGRSGSEKSSRYRARSSSSCSHHSESSHEGTKEKYTGGNNSRRLRSVITVAKEAEESGEFWRNENKEEIVDDHDYPCRSNDSNDGGTKRELDHHTLPASEEKLRVEDEIGDVNADSAGTGMKKTSENSGSNLNGEDLESILRQRALENLIKFRGEMQSTAKASDQKIKIVSQVKQPIIEKHKLVQGKSIPNSVAVGSRFDKQTHVEEETSFPVGRKNMIVYPRNNVSLNMDKDISGSANHRLACATEKVIDADNLRGTVTESINYRTNNPESTIPESFHDSHSLQSRSLKQTSVSGLPQEKFVVTESSKDRGSSEAAKIASQNSNDNVNNTRSSSAFPKPSIHGPELRRNNLNKGQHEVKEHSHFELKQTSASHEEPPIAKPLMAEGDVEKNAANTTQAASHEVKEHSRFELNQTSASHEEPPIAKPLVAEGDVERNAANTTQTASVENNSGKLQDESNQGSQFEQKTMNVMRGGEMVQVSYKVYIPKKAPALARRQLKR